MIGESGTGLGIGAAPCGIRPGGTPSTTTTTDCMGSQLAARDGPPDPDPDPEPEPGF
ncbi:MAG: hypothetical protein ACSLFQ_11875 [Thermoanaerobaculia bacterium]